MSIKDHWVPEGLTLAQFKSILKEVYDKHMLVVGRGIKYVDISFDFRQMKFWRVVMRPFGTPKEFSCANRFEPKQYESLYEEIMEWLGEVYENKQK